MVSERVKEDRMSVLAQLGIDLEEIGRCIHNLTLSLAVSQEVQRQVHLYELGPEALASWFVDFFVRYDRAALKMLAANRHLARSVRARWKPEDERALRKALAVLTAARRKPGPKAARRSRRRATGKKAGVKDDPGTDQTSGRSAKPRSTRKQSRGHPDRT